MIDLVTNFKNIIDKSTISVLEEVFNSVNIDKNKDFIRNITKHYMTMSTKDLKGNVSDNIMEYKKYYLGLFYDKMETI